MIRNLLRLTVNHGSSGLIKHNILKFSNSFNLKQNITDKIKVNLDDKIELVQTEIPHHAKNEFINITDDIKKQLVSILTDISLTTKLKRIALKNGLDETKFRTLYYDFRKKYFHENKDISADLYDLLIELKTDQNKAKDLYQFIIKEQENKPKLIQLTKDIEEESDEEDLKQKQSHIISTKSDVDLKSIQYKIEKHNLLIKEFDLKLKELQINFERMVLRLNELGEEKTVSKKNKQEKKSSTTQTTNKIHDSLFKPISFRILKNQDNKQSLNKHFKFEIRKLNKNESLKSVLDLLTNKLELDVNGIFEMNNDPLNGKSFKVIVPLEQKNLVLDSTLWPKEILLIECD